MQANGSGMKMGTIVVVLLLIVGVIALRECDHARNVSPSPVPSPPAAAPLSLNPTDTPAQREMPHLVDLGAHSCIPCKMMAPILEDFKVNYSDRFKTTFIDVWQDQASGEQYEVRIIPTQIFFDPKGRELFRHEGFFSKDDILATWRRLGYPV